MILIAGAYPAAPRRPLFDDDASYERADDAFTGALVEQAQAAGVAGLELAWQDGALHPRESTHLAALPATWQHVVTAIPDTMITWRTSPQFGLASTDENGRIAAVQRLANLREHIEVLRAAGTSVAAVLVHSAPRVSDVDAGTTALAASLRELGEWDWCGAELLVEHCDSGATGHQSAKGFLPLDSELAALDRAAGLRTPVGALVNWGRSVIEGRSRRTAVDHVASAAASGHLRGVMFSGVGARPGAGAWLDNHLPTSDLTPESLLRPTDIAEALRAAASGRLLVAGVKVTAAATSEDPAVRAADVARTVAHVSAALEASA